MCAVVHGPELQVVPVGRGDVVMDVAQGTNPGRSDRTRYGPKERIQGIDGLTSTIQ